MRRVLLLLLLLLGRWKDILCGSIVNWKIACIPIEGIIGVIIHI